MNLIKTMCNHFYSILAVFRARIMSIKYKIGPHCRFERIHLCHCPRGSVSFGSNVFILRYTEIRALVTHPVDIGDNVFINSGCLIRPNVRIGNCVSVGQQVAFISDTHDIGSTFRRASETSSRFDPIEIGDGCWIGARATILGGVSIGRGCVIAAGSCVISNCEANGLYAGVPAKRIRDLD